jgi:hypothetical protein
MHPRYARRLESRNRISAERGELLPSVRWSAPIATEIEAQQSIEQWRSPQHEIEPRAGDVAETDDEASHAIRAMRRSLGIAVDDRDAIR